MAKTPSSATERQETMLEVADANLGMAQVVASRAEGIRAVLLGPGAANGKGEPEPGYGPGLGGTLLNTRHYLQEADAILTEIDNHLGNDE